MSDVDSYDLVVIGGGAAGINAVKAAIALKARVALVDRGRWEAPALTTAEFRRRPW